MSLIGEHSKFNTFDSNVAFLFLFFFVFCFESINFLHSLFPFCDIICNFVCLCELFQTKRNISLPLFDSLFKNLLTALSYCLSFKRRDMYNWWKRSSLCSTDSHTIVSREGKIVSSFAIAVEISPLTDAMILFPNSIRSTMYYSSNRWWLLDRCYHRYYYYYCCVVLLFGIKEEWTREIVFTNFCKGGYNWSPNREWWSHWATILLFECNRISLSTFQRKKEYSKYQNR